MTRFGIEPAASHSPRCERMSPALMTSATSSVQPGYSRTSALSSEGISDRVVYRFCSRSRYAAKSVGCDWKNSSDCVRYAAEETLGDGAYSPNTMTVFPLFWAFSHRKPPDEYAIASSPSDG